ncbi:restriction endonuclease subunit S [Vibrio splendidus]
MSFELYIPEGWSQVKLSDLGEVNRGRSRHRPRNAAHLYDGPYPFVQTGDVKASKGRVTQHSQTYSEEGLAQSRLWPKGTMCITIAANIAETGILTYPACFPDSVIGFIADESKCNVYFIEYVFRLLRKRIQAQATGSVQDNINLQTLERLLFPVPALEEQNRIAAVLGELDDKVHLNDEINQTLEQMAQAIFKSWFVDFDPVKAKTNGEQPEGMDAATASLFPEKLVESEEGLIPEGWSVEPLKNVSRVINGRAYKNTEFKDEGTPIIRIQNLTGKGKTVYSDMELPKDKLAEHGDLIFAWSATFGPHLWRGPKSIYHYHIWKMDVDETKFGKYLLYLHLARLTDYLKNQGTGSIFTHLTKAIMESQKLVVPSESIVEAFSKVVTPLFAQIDSLHKENKVLEQLRDTLLPKLLSGEIELG